MRNITLAVTEAAYRRARLWGAKRDLSISHVVSIFLEELPIISEAITLYYKQYPELRNLFYAEIEAQRSAARPSLLLFYPVPLRTRTSCHDFNTLQTNSAQAAMISTPCRQIPHKLTNPVIL
jgi:hypothetical protein